MRDTTQNCVLLADRHQDLLDGVRGLLETAFDTVVMVADAVVLKRAIATDLPPVGILRMRRKRDV
jgi:hypothetical protein